jgi:hypothetical protein
MDLELRRMGLEATGWRFTDYGEYRTVPAIECDPAAFWPWFLKWCKSKRMFFDLYSVGPFGEQEFYFELFRMDKGDGDSDRDDEPFVEVFAASIEEAGCRAVVEAMRNGNELRMGVDGFGYPDVGLQLKKRAGSESSS